LARNRDHTRAAVVGNLCIARAWLLDQLVRRVVIDDFGCAAPVDRDGEEVGKVAVAELG